MRRWWVAHPWVADAAGVGWTVLAAVAVMAPLLRPGVSLGSFDLLTRIGLTHQTGVAVHSQFPADQVLYFQPLTDAAWHQVHAGHLPLWNPDSLLGMPLAFSWQSAVFSLPMLIGYLFPAHLAYTVIVFVKFVVAGTGAYLLCRVLGTRPSSAALGATAFCLSGPMLHYAGWAMTGVTCWSGYILAFALLLVRGRHRVRDAVMLAVVVALAVYGGHPESLVVSAISVAAFLGVVLATGAVRHRVTVGRAVRDVVTATACGVGLAAPLALPGLQVVQLSGRASASGGAPYQLSHVSDLLTGVQGTDFRVPSPYLGVIVVVLAVVALRLGWQRAAVRGLGAVVVVGLVLTYKSPLYTLLQNAPLTGRLTWNRDVMLLGLALAVLSALGLDALRDPRRGPLARRWALGGFGAAAVAVGGVSAAVATGAQSTSGGGERARLAWAAAECLMGAALVAASGLGRPHSHPRGDHRSRLRALAAGLLVVQSAQLVAFGVSSWSLSSDYFTPTPAVATLARTVGGAVVGIGPCRPRPFEAPVSDEPGIRPNANAAYGVHEFAVYEPVLPKAYYQSWTLVSGQQVSASLRRVGLFCPQITTATEARVYGVRYLLAPRGTPPPSGTSRVRTVGGETLYEVPGAAPVTLLSAPRGPAPLPVDARGTPVAATHPGPSAWRVVTHASGASVLRVRVSALPGWHATIDGRPLALTTWAAGAMLEARVPGGTHVVELRYWPDLFTAGLVVAVAVLVGLAVAVGLGARARMAARYAEAAAPSQSG